MIKIVECGRCEREMRVEVSGTVDSSRLKCASCKVIESRESVENLMSAIFKTRTKIKNS